MSESLEDLRKRLDHEVKTRFIFDAGVLLLDAWPRISKALGEMRKFMKTAVRRGDVFTAEEARYLLARLDKGEQE